METISCDYCRSQESTTIFHNADWPWLEQNLGVEMVACNRCGLVYLNPRPDKFEIQDFYQSDYPSYAKPILEEKSKLIQWVRRGNLQHRRNYIVKHTNGQNKKLLDVGCSTGLFLGEMRSAGWEVVGVEPNDEIAQIARVKLGLKVHTGFLSSLDIPAETFDVITYWDVLEHTFSPRQELEQAVNLLKSGGLLVINIPNWNAFDRRLFGANWQGYDPPRHLYVFPHDILTKYLTEAGCAVIEWKCLISSYYSMIMGLDRSLQQKVPKLARLINFFLNLPGLRFVFEPFLFPFYIIRRGSVITVVAKKV